MEAYAGFLRVLNRITGLVVMIMLSLLVVIVILAVFFRYVLNDSLTWSAEVARYMCIWIGFLAASLTLRERGHIGLEFFVQRVAGERRRYVSLGCYLLVFFFLVAVAVLGFELALFQLDQRSSALEMSMFWPYLSVPVAAVLMALQTVALMAEDLKGPR